MEDQDPRFREGGPNEGVQSLVSRSWEAAKKHGWASEFFRFRFHTPAALVGLGAPIHIFLPDVARALGTRCIIPADAGVANAVGAVVGNIRATCDIEIKPQYSIDGINGFTVFGAASNSHVADQGRGGCHWREGGTGRGQGGSGATRRFAGTSRSRPGSSSTRPRHRAGKRCSSASASPPRPSEGLRCSISAAAVGATPIFPDQL